MTLTAASMMRTVMKSAEFEELVIVRDYPEGIGTLLGMTEKESCVDYTCVKGTMREILMEGLMISHRDFHIEREFIMEVDHNFPFLKMQFELEGYSHFSRQNKACLDTDIPGGRQQLFFFPEVKGKLTYPPSHRYTLEIILSVNYLTRSFGQDLTALHHFGRGIERNEPVQFFPASQPISPAMKRIILEFIHCPYTGTVRRLFLEAKVMELLVLQIDSLNQYRKYASEKKIKKEDIEKLYYVREILDKNPAHDYSLSGISELTGLNDFKLKQGFKAIFNDTVFGYLTNVRMEKARNLLLESTDSIAEVAFAIGYKNPQHFSVAFKRKFGCLPKSLR